MKPPKEEQTCILLSPLVLDYIHKLTPASLKIYIYLCSEAKDDTVSVPIPAIAGGVRLGKRAVVDGLAMLRKTELITSTAGKGHEANCYCIPRPHPIADATLLATPEVSEPQSGCDQPLLGPPQPETMEPESKMSVPAPASGLAEPAVACTCERGQVLAAEPSDRANAAPTFDELVASVYRPLSEDDQSRLNEWLAERKLTRDKFYDMLGRFVCRQRRLFGVARPGVAIDKDLSFFVQIVIQES